MIFQKTIKIKKNENKKLIYLYFKNLTILNVCHTEFNSIN